ncbi:MAG: 4-hydroxy-3-methylbut-2-enyl diphosphate reductase [Bacteroidota bacterium]
MNVRIDPSAGFCWGVVRTIDIAEQELRNGSALVSLGDIIHNPKETGRLDALGMKTIDHAQMEELPDGTRVLIRAHGEPAATYRRAQELGLQLIDATCPIVTKLQERIRKYYLEDWQVVIFGKKDHAEVIGLRGVCNDDCIVVKTLDEARDAVDLTRRTVLFSQTTMDKPTFQEIRDYLRAGIAEFQEGSMEEIAIDFHAKETICGQVSGRDKKLRSFAAENDVMIFVAGRKSSNGKVLFHICLEANPRTFFVEDADEIDPSWFEGVENVGISGATSTPHWLMKEVQSHIEQLATLSRDGLAAATINQQHDPTNR